MINQLHYLKDFFDSILINLVDTRVRKEQLMNLKKRKKTNINES